MFSILDFLLFAFVIWKGRTIKMSLKAKNNVRVCEWEFETGKNEMSALLFS